MYFLMLLLYVVLLAGPLAAHSTVASQLGTLAIPMRLAQPFGMLDNNFTNAEQTGTREAPGLTPAATPSPFKNQYKLRNF